MNYTLDLTVTGPFSLESADDALTMSKDGQLTFTSDGWPYPLRSVAQEDGFDPSQPGRIWANATSSSHEVVKVPQRAKITITTSESVGSRVWVNGDFAGRFEVFVYGGKNTVFSWSQMAFVAPLQTIRGKGLQKLTLH
jgi:hexosaminidase